MLTREFVIAFNVKVAVKLFVLFLLEKLRRDGVWSNLSEHMDYALDINPRLKFV
jgi:hypothetical protein